MKHAREESKNLLWRCCGIFWINLVTELLSAENATHVIQGGNDCFEIDSIRTSDRSIGVNPQGFGWAND